MMSTLHQDTHAVHGHDANHQQAERTQLGTEVVDKRERSSRIRREPERDWMCRWYNAMKALLGTERWTAGERHDPGDWICVCPQPWSRRLICGQWIHRAEVPGRLWDVAGVVILRVISKVSTWMANTSETMMAPGKQAAYVW